MLTLITHTHLISEDPVHVHVHVSVISIHSLIDNFIVSEINN